MILYFADRHLNILGQASTYLPEGVRITNDLKTEDVDAGVAVFECDIHFDRKTRAKVEEWAEVGNYVLRSTDNENEFYNIIDCEIDTKNQKAYIYAEDDGLDLINEIAGPYTADQPYPISNYIERFASGAGWTIGVNEVEGLTKQLSWTDEQTASARLLSIAEAFDNCEISFSFRIKGLQIVKKYINIYEERGKDTGVQLRLNKEIDSIVISKTVGNLATALKATGSTPEDAEEPITLLGYEYDDGDFYVDGDVLKSRKAFDNWSRYLWKNDDTEQAGGHITKTFSYETTSQNVLCEETIAQLKKICDMEVNYDIDITKLPDNVKIGDRVNIIDDTGALYLSSRLLILETSEVEGTRKATLGEHLIKRSGISSQVAKLAENFTKQAVSVKNATKIAANAREAAVQAKNQVDAAIKSVEDAHRVVEEVVDVVDTAKQSAAEAQTAAANAQRVVDEVETRIGSLETTVSEAQQAIDNAHQAAETAAEKANEANAAAKNAEANAASANSKADDAKSSAANATSKAETAINAANNAKSEARTASIIAKAAKKDALQAETDIENLENELSTVSDTMSAEYSRKTDLTDATASLQSQISRNAGKISQNISATTMIDETANNALTTVQAAQNAATLAQEQADQASIDAENAQVTADEAWAAAVSAQNDADIAQAAADTAKSVADKAKADLRAAEEDLVDISSQIDVTEKAIAEAQKAVDDAQAVANAKKAEAQAAATAAKAAQEVANTALDAATKAQAAADKALNDAEIAQQVADEAKGNVTAVQKKVSDALEIATSTKQAADDAKAIAETLQAEADNTYLEAVETQVAVENAIEKANQAESDLADAQRRLAEVQAQASSTAEEIAEAQAAVDTAQAKATEARESANAAQQAANTATENATNAQQAADLAKAEADIAQAAAKTAQDEVDKALGLVYSLEKRITTAETGIEQTKSEIRLFAKKDEVIRTLGGYYTKEQANAEISTKADEINLSVERKVANVQVGGRNLLKNSRHINLSSNNAALYPVAYTTKTENGREYRRYRRTETTLSPTTMSLYSSIPVNQITECLTGQEITFSFLIRCSHNTTTSTMNRLVVNGVNYTFSPEKTHNIGAEWQRISVTANITQEYEVNGSNMLRFNPLMIPIPSGVIDTFYIDVCEWKIEKGNKATDWTPAPEDVDEKFLDYSTTEEMNAAINVSAEGIRSTVKAMYTTKEDFNNLNVGGRNLVRDSSLKEKTDMWNFSTDNTYSFENGYCEVYRTTANGSRTFNSQSTNANTLLKPDNLAGGTFTLSAEIKRLDGYSVSDGSTLFYRCNTTELTSGFQEISIKLGGATTEWQKVYATFTFGDHNFDGSCQVCIALENAVNAGICVRNIKLESGNKATAWTPALEDTSTEIDGLQDTINGYADYGERLTKAESLIEQLSHTIIMLVRDANGQSQMTQESTEVEYAFFSTEEIDKAIEDTAKTLGDLNEEYGATKTTVDTLQQALDDMGERVKFTTYEDEPCIILYENDSDYKQIITNTRRIFIQTVDGVDTILNVTDYETTQNKNVIATEKAQIGGFAWKKRGTNRISLVWEGEID